MGRCCNKPIPYVAPIIFHFWPCPGLVLCLSNEDPNIILTSLEALKYLSSYSPNRAYMKNHMGMIPTLQVRYDLNCYQPWLH